MTLYLDASSLVKLYVEEPGAQVVRRAVRAASIVATCAIAYAEARAAFAQRRRERILSAVGFKTVKRDLDDDWPSYLVLEPTMAICRLAGVLAERYRLRGYDSVHLAAFLEVARQAGDGKTQFSSFDDRLNRAARAARRAKLHS